MWSWAPIVAVAITTVVNLMMAFGGWLKRRAESEDSLERRFDVSESETEGSLERIDRDVSALGKEIGRVRARVHDLNNSTNHTLGDFRVRLALLERDVESLQHDVSALAKRHGEGA